MKLKCLFYYGLLRISGEVWNLASSEPQFPVGKTVITIHSFWENRIYYIKNYHSV